MFKITKKLNPIHLLGFPGGSVIKNPPANAGNMGLIPGQEDPTCHGATEPVCHTTAAEPVLWSLGAATAEPVAPTIEVHAPYSQRSATRSHRNEKPAQQ